MSLASSYAANYDASQRLSGAPTPFVVDSGRAEVVPNGNLRLTRTSGGYFELTAAEAVSLASWLNSTFG